ncbi:putative membrane protein [Metabacillus crassostreae]|uniref:small multi-drug export protein n=1 Tax=Metabacillus crassostreae TaxID=929098 RepID=UPI00195849F6|nr:small multi-drug export protein [Metabacillus crassostreae]MBM7602921.1 putative membrane protein [Metabacillus crassostreae]
MFISYLLVFVLAAVPLFELIAVIPLAIIGGLSPIPVAILAFLGNALTILLLILFVDKIKTWRKKKKQKRMAVSGQEAATLENAAEVENDSKKAKRARVLFDKYGLPGLAIIGPFFVGSHISAFMGMSFGSKRSLVTTWMLISLGLWTIVTAVASSYGVSYFIPNVGEDGFITRIFQQ